MRSSIVGRLSEVERTNPVRSRVVRRSSSVERTGSVQPTYDLNHGVRGGTVIGLYFAPALRGRGIALELVCAAAADVTTKGGVFLHAGSYERHGPVGRVYERVAIGFDSAECFVSGRAFRRLADLAGASARDILRDLPDRSENHEP